MKRWLMVMLAAAVGGCATLQSEHVLTGQAGPPYQGNVQVVMEGAPDPGPFEEIGIVSAHGELEQASLPAVIGALQQEAAALGGNAVIRVRYDRGANGATATGVAVRLARDYPAAP